MGFFPAGLAWRGRAMYLAHAGKALFRQHHRELLPLLGQFVDTNAVVLDIGAHAGQFTKLFARLAPAGQVFAFEPSSYARSILTLAVRTHRLTNVTIVASALGDAPGQATLSTPVKAAGSVRFGLAHLGAATAARTEVVPVVPLDQFAAQHRLTKLSFVKAEVEGWELRMLSGGAETLRGFRPPLLLELVDNHLRRAGDTLPAAWSTLQAWGYAPHAWKGGDRLTPLASL